MYSKTNEQYDERIEGLMSYIKKNAQGDIDLEQVQCIGIWRALDNNPECSDAYLKTRAYWNMLRYMAIRKDEYDNEQFAEHLTIDNELSTLEKRVLLKMGFEDFLKDLNSIEREYIKERISGKTDKDILSRNGLTKNGLSFMKKRLKNKFCSIFLV